MALEQPKKAPTAYFLWLSDNREAIQKEIGSKKAPDVSKAAGLKWKALSDVVKAPFEKKAAAEKIKYDSALQAFTDQGGVRKRSTKGKGEKKEKDPNKPKKPAGGAYGVFLAEKRESVKASLPAGHKITDVTKKVGEMWKTISESEKAKYEKVFAEKNAAWKAAMEEYKKNGGADDDGEEEDGEEEDEEEKVQEPVSKRTRKAGA